MSQHSIERIDQAAVLLKPLRIEVLRLSANPITCPQLASVLGITMQKAWYHIKVLERASLVQRVGERRVNGLREGIYQAVAEAYALSSQLTEMLVGEKKAREQTAVGVIQSMAEQLLEDTAKLSGNTGKASALGLTAKVELAPSRRAAFVEELQKMVQTLGRKHSASENAWETETYKFVLACYKDPS